MLSSIVQLLSMAIASLVSTLLEKLYGNEELFRRLADAMLLRKLYIGDTGLLNVINDKNLEFYKHHRSRNEVYVVHIYFEVR